MSTPLGYDGQMDGIGVLGVAVGLVIALSPKGHPTRDDPSMRRLGWLLAAASFLLLLAGTLAPPSSSGNHQVPSAPAPMTPSRPVPVYPQGHTVAPGG